MNLDLLFEHPWDLINYNDEPTDKKNKTQVGIAIVLLKGKIGMNERQRGRGEHYNKPSVKHVLFHRRHLKIWRCKLISDQFYIILCLLSVFCVFGFTALGSSFKIHKLVCAALIMCNVFPQACWHINISIKLKAAEPCSVFTISAMQNVLYDKLKCTWRWQPTT